MELILVISKHDISCLGNIRTIPDLKVAEHGDELWLRGVSKESSYEKELRKLPVLKAYTISNELLFPVDGITPVGKLESLDWKLLTDFFTLELPLSAIPGKTDKRVPVRLIPCTNEQEEEALLTSLEHWKAFAGEASEVRLKGLMFAASEHGEVFIIGNPLPPLPGKAFWSREGIYLPCGFDFEFPLMAELLNEKMTSFDDTILIFVEDGKLISVSADHFASATRSAIRMTKGGINE